MSGVCSVIPDTSQEIRSGQVMTKEELPSLKEGGGPLELLMEKIRTKANHYKSWTDMAKAFRVAIVEKRHLMDATERSQLQKCLDTIQKSIKVTSLQSMVERLESITRQQGLKFSTVMSGTDCFISSDMFYVEVLLQESTGEVKDVKIAHHAEPVSCPELTKVLSMGDFSTFTSHLEGLSAIYQLNADKKQKAKAYLALSALETDLSMLSQIQSSINEPSNLVHKSPVGILQPRKGGHPMKLTFFISPYDLLDIETKTSIPLTVDVVLERQLGHMVTVCIESSTAHKLQTVSLITISKTPEGKSLPSFAALSNLNSTTLPACFVLKLPNPVPMATSFIKKIQAVTSIECADLTNMQPLLVLITKETSNGKLDCRANQGLYVTLPDQQHCYFLNSSTDLQGVLVSSIPFTHPTHVPQILVFLRQQLLFNTVVGSCIRPSSKQDAESALMFEVTALSINHISVSFEHPLEESLATVDLDLRDVTSVKCKIYTISSYTPICTDEYASKVMQRCLSIPVTMRAVIRKAQGQQYQVRPSSQGDMYYTPVSGSGGLPYLSQLPGYGGAGVDGGSTGFGGSDFATLASKISANKGNECTASAASPVIAANEEQPCCASSPHQSHSEGKRKSIDAPGSILDDLLALPSMDGGAASQSMYQQGKSANAMLMSMLSDVPAANSASPAASFPFAPTNGKPRKQRKRKLATDTCSPGSAGSSVKSPKRKHGEDDLSKDASKDFSLLDFAESGDSTTLPFEMTQFEGSGMSDGNKTGPSGSDLYQAHELCTSPISVDNDTPVACEGNVNGNANPVSEGSQNKMHEGGSMGLGAVVADPLDFCSELLPENRDAGSEQCDTDADKCDASFFGDVVVPKSASSDRLVKRQRRSSVEEAKGQATDLNLDHDELLKNSESDVILVSDPSDDSVGDEKQKKESLAFSVSSQMAKSGNLSSSTIGTSFKIAKSGENNLKISKLEGKIRQKESRRSSSASDDTSDSGKRKGELKKERKRKRAESFDNLSLDKAVGRPVLDLESSLMPPPMHGSDDSGSGIVASGMSDLQPLRPITLNVKPLTPTSSSQTSPTKTTVSLGKKQGSGIAVGNKTGGECASPTVKDPSKVSKLPTKPSSPRHPSQLASSSKWLDSDMTVTSVASKVPVSSPSVKAQAKHKQSSVSRSLGTSSSSSVASSHLGGSTILTSSTKSSKSTPLKLKHLNLPASTTITPITTSSKSSPTPSLGSVPHNTLSSSTSAVVNSLSITPANPGSKLLPHQMSSKTNKSAVRSRKGSLSAVIDKLMETASNAKHSAAENCLRSDFGGTKLDGPVAKEKREASTAALGGGGNAKLSDAKPKYSSSDQFTVKQSSQGIKLTVTKTRSSEGHPKSKGRSQAASSKVTSSSVTSAMSSPSHQLLSCSNKQAGPPGGNFKAAVVLVQGMKPKNSGSAGVNLSTKRTSTSGNLSSKSFLQKGSPTGSHGGSLSMPTMIPKTSISVCSAAASPKLTLSSSKGANNSLQNKGSKGVVIEKAKVTANKLPSEMLEMMAIMAPPSSGKMSGEQNRCTGGNAAKRTDESPLRHSPRQTPTRENSVEECEVEKAFRAGTTEVASLDGVTCKYDFEEKIQRAAAATCGSSNVNIETNTLPSSPSTSSDNEDCQRSSAGGVLSLSSAQCPVELSQDVYRGNGKVDAVCALKMDPAVGSSAPYFDGTFLSQSSRPSKLSAKIKSSVGSDDNSSPEDGLVIDCPSTPRVQKSPERKPLRCNSPTSVHSANASTTPTAVLTGATEEKTDKQDMSPPNTTSKSPYHHSPVMKSPMQVVTPPSNHSVSSSISRPSPYVIDDDLMDEALVGLGK